MVWRGDDCKPFWSRVEIPTWMQIFFSLIFVRIHTNEVIQIIVRIRIRCGFCTNSYNFLYEYCIVRIHTTSREWRSLSREGKARAHLLPRPGRTRLPRPVRVRSWGTTSQRSSTAYFAGTKNISHHEGIL